MSKEKARYTTVPGYVLDIRRFRVRLAEQEGRGRMHPLIAAQVGEDRVGGLFALTPKDDMQLTGDAMTMIRATLNPARLALAFETLVRPAQAGEPTMLSEYMPLAESMREWAAGRLGPALIVLEADRRGVVRGFTFAYTYTADLALAWTESCQVGDMAPDPYSTNLRDLMTDAHGFAARARASIDAEARRHRKPPVFGTRRGGIRHLRTTTDWLRAKGFHVGTRPGQLLREPTP